MVRALPDMIVLLANEGVHSRSVNSGSPSSVSGEFLGNREFIREFFSLFSHQGSFPIQARPVLQQDCGMHTKIRT
jgi:hypothetical protein